MIDSRSTDSGLIVTGLLCVLFVAFPWVETSTGPGGFKFVHDLCVYYMTGTPEGSTESGFMKKPGIEPATPGLQGIALIHYFVFLSKIVNYLLPLSTGSTKGDPSRHIRKILNGSKRIKSNKSKFNKMENMLT